MTCPPCNHNCNEGRDCPARTNLIKKLWQRYLSNITLVRFTAWPAVLTPPVLLYLGAVYLGIVPGWGMFFGIMVAYLCLMMLLFGD